MSNELSISDGDRIITGRFIYRSRRTIQVEITSGIYPFRLATTMYVPESRSPGGLLGGQGIASGENMLRVLDRISRFLEDNRLTLVDNYREFRGVVKQVETAIGLSDYMFDMICRSLDMDLKSGKIDKEKYDREIAEAQERNGRYHRGYRAVEKEFFSRIFPLELPQDLVHQILAWLNWQDVDAQSSFVATMRR